MIMHIDIYTDGGCSGNPGPGGWAFIILETPKTRMAGTAPKEPQNVLLERYGAGENTTNNRMELQAAISALEALRSELKLKPATISIFTDSQYLQKGSSEWIITWKRSNWRNSAKEPVKNQDLWRSLDEICGEFASIEWIWVRGHAGNEFNERCDRMTQDAIAGLGQRA